MKIFDFLSALFRIDYGFRAFDFFTRPASSGGWTGITLICYCSHSNLLLGQFLAVLVYLIWKSRNSFFSTGFLIHCYFVWKPSWLTSQPFLQFILNSKNHPNLAVPVYHTQCRHDNTLAARVVDFILKSPPWQGCKLHIVLRTHSSRKVTKQCLIDNLAQFWKLSLLTLGGNHFSS